MRCCAAQVHIQAVQRWLAVFGLWLCIVLIGLLNPLVCLIHCAAVQAAHATHMMHHGMAMDDATHAAMPADAMTMHMAHQDAMASFPFLADTPTDAHAATPRAVYEALALTYTLLALMIVVLALPMRLRPFHMPRLAYPPLAPPPRLPHHFLNMASIRP